MEILIPAAGFATRLYPLTLDKPKGLIEINGKPMIEIIFENIKKIEGIKRAHIITNNKFFSHFQKWAEKYMQDNPLLEIFVYNNGVDSDDKLFGAVKDIQNFLMKKHPKDFLVIPPDNLFDFELSDMKKLFDSSGKSMVAIKETDNRELLKKCACVMLDNEGKIVYFEEKPEFPATNLLATAAYMLTKEDIEKIKFHNFGEKKNMGDMIEMLINNQDVRGYVFKEFWTDIGNKEQLEEAQRVWQK